jgi:signal transduction histidine kinase
MENATCLLEGLERASLMMVTTTPEGLVEYVNPSARALLGDLSGVDLSDPPPCDDPKGPLAGLIGLWESRSDSDVADESGLIQAKRRGSPIYLWVHSIRLGASGSAGRLFLIADLTTQVVESEPVRHLVGQLAHDLRSPLTSIAGAAELLLSGRVGSLATTQAKLVKIVDGGATKLNTIIRGVSGEEREGGAAE